MKKHFKTNLVSSFDNLSSKVFIKPIVFMFFNFLMLNSPYLFTALAEEDNKEQEIEITDINKKIRELTKSAYSGDSEAQFLLGEIALKNNSPPDHATAVYWFRIAAESNHLQAQELLGAHLFAGLGVPQNSPEARNWWLKAANKGSMKAQASLGVLYALGNGIEKDLIEAYKWLTLAAIEGNKTAKEQRDDSLALQMTADEIRIAQKRVQIFLEEQRSNQN